MRRLAVCVLAFLFLTCSLPAQQSGDAPGWPITNPMPSYGKVIPDPTIGLQRPETGPTDESCLLGAVDGRNEAQSGPQHSGFPEKRGASTAKPAVT